MDTTLFPVYGAAAGFLSHWTYFIHGEHHVQAPILLRISLSLPVVVFGGLWHFTNRDWVSAVGITVQLLGSYYAALWTSILTYRIFFHRLNKFPGPFMFKVSKLWHVFKLAPKSDNYLQLDELHKRYGDFVRTGKFLWILIRSGD